MSKPWVRCRPRNQVADRLAEPDEERAADSSMVSGRSDPLDDFVVPLDDPIDEITEQWQDGLDEWYVCRDEQPLLLCRFRQHKQCDAHSASRDPGVVLPQKPSRVLHVFGLPSPREVDPTDRTHFPGISRVATNGSGVVGKIATTARMMCLYVLMVGATSCLDWVAHSIPVVRHFRQVAHVWTSFTWMFETAWSNGFAKKNLMNRVDLVQLGGHVPNPKDRYTAVRRRGGKTRHVRQNRLATVSDRSRWRAKLEEYWRPITLALVVHNKKSQSLLAYVADMARDQHRRDGRVFLTFPWNWNVLTTWPIQSVTNEAPFLCAREGKKRILTNCVDTARLVGLVDASLSCLNVW